MPLLGLHLGAQLQVVLLHEGALVRDLLALLVRQVPDLRHLRRGLRFVLLVDLQVVVELLSESISRLDGVPNGLQGLQTASLLVEGRVLAIRVDPLLRRLQILQEGRLERRIDVVLVVAVLGHAIFHLVSVRLQVVLGFFQVEDLAILDHELALEVAELHLEVGRDRVRDSLE